MRPVRMVASCHDEVGSGHDEVASGHGEAASGYDEVGPGHDEVASGHDEVVSGHGFPRPLQGPQEKNAIVSPLAKLKNVTIYIVQGHRGRGIRMACDGWMTIMIPEAPTGASGKIWPSFPLS